MGWSVTGIALYLIADTWPSFCDVDFSSRRKNKRHFRSQKCSGLRWSIVMTLPSFQCLIRRVYVRKVGRQTEPLGAAETWALLSHCDYVVLVSCHTLVRPHCLTKIHQQQLICNDSFALLVRFDTGQEPGAPARRVKKTKQKNPKPCLTWLSVWVMRLCWKPISCEREMSCFMRFIWKETYIV